ncbi:AAA family ATPase [Sodalis ligni]|uniref:Putative AbiEii toxin of type IV toxin-antitoxin system n=1 Tax=Sodalis ligni TaxID=2697027 RepID=A0A4R1NIS4_9GAMM|nr:AAA family ATPase [Sodalis ligni]TCL06989.1 putative AbiEii toxin of type IV toxin-antitoxin system [Sodalis ligni]
MQLRHLSIPHFRNLRDAELQFATHLDPTPGRPDELSKSIRSHALIGQNGTGKSNLIEVLITIFRNIDLDQESGTLDKQPLDYTLEYEIRGHAVRLQADTRIQKRPFVWVDGDKQSQGYLLKNRELLPSHVFAYYSGRNERIEGLFQEHQRRFNRRQEIVAEEVLPAALLTSFTGSESDIRSIQEAKRREESRLQYLGDDRLRRLFYCRGGHSQLVLLACLLSDDPVFQKVLKNLNIESLESALFVLKEPHRLRTKRRESKFEENELNEGDPRFWYARGNVVSEFLDKLWQVAWVPIAQEVDKQIDFRGRTERQRQIYLYVPSHEKLKLLGELVGGTDSFFRYAEGAYIGDLIDEVRITVKKRDEHGGKVSFTQLSEGELQMLTVLGLMRITRDDHCLFLLDEPDTHLNPLWKLRCFDDIEDALSNAEGLGAAGESQVLLTTHDPILLSSLLREQVHILRGGTDKTLVDVPDEHPRGMGVAGLLKSELFGLSSTLDRRTLEDLDRRNELLAKEVKGELSAREQDELEQLKAYLTDLGFSREYRDPLYQMFVQKMYEARNLPMAQLLTLEQQQLQNQLAEQIAKNMIADQRMSEMEALANALQRPEGKEL